MAACLFDERCEALPGVRPNLPFNRTRPSELFVLRKRRWRRAAQRSR